MRRSLSEAELMASFRTRDRKHVQLPSELRFPVEVDPLLTWEMGPRVFLVLADLADRPPLGIVFARDTSGPAVPAMCDWCQTTRGRGEVTLLSCEVNPRRYVGLYLCRDLSCGQQAADSPRPENFYDRHSAEERRKKHLERVRVFAKRHLF